MTEQNVEALRRVYERWAEGDFRASLEVFDPLVLMVQSGDFPDAGAYLGVERVREFMRGFLEPWTRLEAPELTPELRDRMVEGCLREAAGRSIAELERERDEFLVELLALRERHAVDGPAGA